MKKDCKVCKTPNRSTHHRMSCLKGTKFIRTVKKSCLAKFRLPTRVARNVGEFLQNGALLYGQGVNVVRVEVVHTNGGCTFGDGWSKFCRAHNVAKGFVLVFKYLGYSAFRVDIFNGRTGMIFDQAASRGSGTGNAEAASEEPTEPKPVGRPRVHFQQSEEVGDVTLYGMKLYRFTMYNLRAELRRRKQELTGCKGELIERLGRFIMRHGENYHFDRIRFGQEWRWI